MNGVPSGACASTLMQLRLQVACWVKEIEMRSQLSARHWIGGEWVDSVTRLDSINPAASETIGTYANASAIEVTQAIAVARQAFFQTDWKENRRLRAKAINEMADRFEARMDDLVEILSLENGKVRDEAKFEVSMVPSKLRFTQRWH
jgi:betaine-aldehyde dehydrogenase